MQRGEIRERLTGKTPHFAALHAGYGVKPRRLKPYYPPNKN
jgi:hypothetical protein